MSIIHSLTIEMEDSTWEKLVALADHPLTDTPKGDVQTIAASIFADAVEEVTQNIRDEESAPVQAFEQAAEKDIAKFRFAVACLINWGDLDECFDTDNEAFAGERDHTRQAWLTEHGDALKDAATTVTEFIGQLVPPWLEGVGDDTPD